MLLLKTEFSSSGIEDQMLKYEVKGIIARLGHQGCWRRELDNVSALLS